MRIVCDGRQVEKLDSGMARRILVGADPPVVEGVILSADELVADARGKSRLGLGLCGAVVAVILIAALINSDPANLIFLAPLYLAIMAGLTLAGRAIHQRNMARQIHNTAIWLSRVPPPGTMVCIDAHGITLGASTTAWSDVTVTTVELAVDRDTNTQSGYLLEAVVLDLHGRSVTLDQNVFSHGEAIIKKVLRAKRIQFR